MADCTNTVEFLAEYKRMHEEITFCFNCPLERICLAAYNTNCVIETGLSPTMISIVQKWSDTHPAGAKYPSFKDVFLKKFPNARVLDGEGCRLICRAFIFGQNALCTSEGYSCKKCWNEPYQEQEKDNG